MTLETNLANRRWLLERLRAEVVGPDPVREPEVKLDSEILRRLSKEELYRKRKCQVNGEEILWQDPPGKRYGAGILYPALITAAVVESETETPDSGNADEFPTMSDEQFRQTEKLLDRSSPLADDSEDYDVSLANAYRPSAIGLSFLAELGRETSGFSVELVNVVRLGKEDIVETASAIYRRKPMQVGDDDAGIREHKIWFRTPLVDEHGRYPSIEISSGEISGKGLVSLRKPLPGFENILVVIVSRPWIEQSERNQRLITVSLVNCQQMNGDNLDERCVFQSGLRIRGLSGDDWIVPYPEYGTDIQKNMHADDAVNQLLYRDQLTYAIGHGCAADWQGSPIGGTGAIWSDVLPVHETPPVTADLETRDSNGNVRNIRVSMRKLAGLVPEDDGQKELEELINAYEDWIDGLNGDRPEASPVPKHLAPTASELIARCRKCLERIRDGMSLLSEPGWRGDQVRASFRLANHAMLIAQIRAGSRVRLPKPNHGSYRWEPPIDNPDPAVPLEGRGYWRPFQIAFLLMSLRGICEPDHQDRDTVDLIWFPTGGGKTEAYLGLTAFTIFYNRLSGRESGGVDVLMRYTLRLLTAQQFQRAALLFCAMEYLRKHNPEYKLEGKAFRLGLWVGGDTTPNTRAVALIALAQLGGHNGANAENPFVLLRCPWCGARFGRKGESEDKCIPVVTGYCRQGAGPAETVVYRCPDNQCEFGPPRPLAQPRDPLPVVVIDDDLIEEPPNLLIGTVDKFAMLAWKPALRRFFGIGEDGQHHKNPPTLIIQDELHLISGPLGTMVGAYETVIDRLCRQHGVGDIGPKIVASTATISRANEQVRHLYARDRVMLFPPSGLEAGDSFFAREDRGSPGRLYAGILAPGHGSLQTTQARVFGTLLQYAAIMETDAAGRDPWWTLLCFFNSLRELGGAATLFVTDARDYLRVILDRHGIEYNRIRSPFAVELTSRIRSDEIPRELARLEVPFSDSPSSERAVDVCLASSIIEVGVDVPRLSIMAVVGQPKTTSQYIQVSSRVGRGPEKPGLVTVLYGQSKPRDRSHYERFRSYHQKLYAQVEPTSVTPFSLPAVDRALHALVVAAVRQLGELDHESHSPDPFPLGENTVIRRLVDDMVRSRVDFVAGKEETAAVMELLARRLEEWRCWNPSEYGAFGNPPPDPPLMYPAGKEPLPDWNRRGWSTSSSMRNVDAGCEAGITDWFNQIDQP